VQARRLIENDASRREEVGYLSQTAAQRHYRLAALPAGASGGVPGASTFRARKAQFAFIRSLVEFTPLHHVAIARVITAI